MRQNGIEDHDQGLLKGRNPLLFNIFPILLLALVLPGMSIQAEARQALVLDIDGSIGPATADYIRGGFAQAREQQAVLVVLRLDTPGGLDAAMRDIVKEILASPVPVVGYVGPSGARAASAGTYILQACHIAAMARATTLGSATPVRIGGLPKMPSRARDAPSDEPDGSDDEGASAPATDEAQDTTTTAPSDAQERKLINDAAAYLRGLATLRGRNADWAEQAVLAADNLTAEEARAQDVIDLIADDVTDLLNQLNGRSVEVLGSMLELDTTGLGAEMLEPSWRTRLLAIVTNPNIAYVLLLIGIYGLIYELANPGAMIPGVSGAIALVLALYAFQALPVNFAGLALLLLGIGFMVLEAFVPSFGALGIGGVIAFTAGSVMLFREDAGEIGVALPVVITFVVLSAALFIGMIGFAVKNRHKPVVSGSEELVGAYGEALEDFDRRGRIRVHSESWTAQSECPVRKGQRVRVVAIDGLTLTIEEASDAQS
jgi:membrane-bound serine protease (ClpP class)